MRINFLLDSLGICGGVKTTLMYANSLIKKGHNVTIIICADDMSIPLTNWSPGTKGWKELRKKIHLKNRISKLKLLLGKRRKPISCEWYSVKAKIIEVPDFSYRYIPNADITVATYWRAACWLSFYPKSKGKKFYIIQVFEEDRRMDRVYSLPLKKITKAEFIKRKLISRINEKEIEVVYDGIDTTQFFPDGKTFKKAETVGMVCYETPFKGTLDGIKVFQRLKKKFPYLKLILFGTKKIKGIPSNAEFYLAPPQEEIRKLYSKMDIFLYPSKRDVCPNPPMEAMACKCAVVSTKVGAVSEYAINGKTALLCAPGDIDDMFEKSCKLIENEELLKTISEAGYKHIIKNFTLEKSIDKLEKIFLKSLEK